jgi:lipopolysaccharide cholinephosphotransferase
VPAAGRAVPLPAALLRAGADPVGAEVALAPEEVRAVQLGVLRELDALCRANGLTYYLSYGTLLGAARHGGFIPWDDDVDVMMPRADHDRLLHLFPSLAPDHLVLGTPSVQPGWPLPFTKISDRRTTVQEPLAVPIELGVNIDVFPVDGMPRGALAAACQARVLRVLRWAVEVSYLMPARARLWHGRLAVDVTGPLLRRLGIARVVRALDRVARAPAASSDAEVGVRVGSYDWSVPPAALGEPGELLFEGTAFLVPADHEQVLTAMYGDWRVPPPPSERVSHHAFTAAWREPPGPGMR